MRFFYPPPILPAWGECIILERPFHCFLTMMLEKNGERLLVVDHNDRVVSTIAKKEAHLKSRKNIYPHRAFSVFLFNQDREMLIQQRSHKKVTFPGLWSNTCCSHPLNTPEERNERYHEGIKRAAVRRMKFELGLDTQIKDYILHEKILYRSDSDEVFEEYEMDYILRITMDVDIKKAYTQINGDEVADLTFMSKSHLIDKVRNHKENFTPWFKLIIDNKINDLFLLFSNKKEDQEIKITNYIG